MPPVCRLNKGISCFGAKVYSFKICDCLLDVTFYAL